MKRLLPLIALAKLIGILCGVSALAGETNKIEIKTWTEIVTNPVPVAATIWVPQIGGLYMDKMGWPPPKPNETHEPREDSFEVLKVKMIEVDGRPMSISSEVIRRFKTVTTFTITTNVETIVTEPILINGRAPVEVKNWRAQMLDYIKEGK